QTDPNSGKFEREVLRRLMERGFNVIPQYRAGAYKIDLVVSSPTGRLAVECDGDRYHDMNNLKEDMERQAILERLGWKFVRIRGSIFFRDSDRAMKPVFDKLSELGISPQAPSNSSSDINNSDLIDRVVRRSQKILQTWHNVKEH
ncbi:MAG TPA: DUF559 domain-containing protein, partial [Candidatus Kapabacteria bacterium]|nr:DUF559 domain-containing protein [Candidatus Kapabacteria bacterium]